MAYVSIDKEYFSNVVGTAKLALAKSDLIPVLQAFKIDGSHVTAWNDVVGISVDTGTEISDETVCPKGNSLVNFVKQASGDSINISIGDDEFEVVSQSTKMKVPVQDSNSFPDLPSGNEQSKEWSVTVSADQISFGLDKCLKTVGSQRDFLIYNSICMGTDPTTKNFTLYSSDNISLSKYVTSESVGEVNRVLIPKELAKAVTSSIGKLGEDEQMTISVYENFINIYIDSGITIIGRRISANPPNYNQPIDTYVSEIQDGEDVFPITDDVKQIVNRMKGMLPANSLVSIEAKEDTLKMDVVENGVGDIQDSTSLPHVVNESYCKLGIDKLSRAISAGDFMFISDNCIGVFNGPLGEYNYTHLVSAAAE